MRHNIFKGPRQQCYFQRYGLRCLFCSQSFKSRLPQFLFEIVSDVQNAESRNASVISWKSHKLLCEQGVTFKGEKIFGMISTYQNMKNISISTYVQKRLLYE
jgi:hypothetical protein